MKRQISLWIFALLLLGFSAASAAYVPLRGDIEGDRPQIEILRHDADQVQIEVRLPGVNLSEAVLEGRKWDRVDIPGGGLGLDLGAPEVPHFTRLLAIPTTAGVRAEFEVLEVETLSDIELMPAQGAEPEELVGKSQPVRFDMAAYSQDAFYPAEEVKAGDPALMRGLRLVALHMNPVRYNPITKELRVAHRFRVTIHFEGTDLRNIPQHPMRPVSRSWAKLMRSVILNYDQLDLEEVGMGPYLIVCEDDTYLLNTVLPPLVEWKRRKGHRVEIYTFSAGASTTTIKNIIQLAYDTWDIPPEFVLLYGDVTGPWTLPGYSVSSYRIDHPYSQLDGGDILADVAIGRIPAENNTEAIVIRNKVLFYEKTPYVANHDWYHQGVVVAGSSYSGLSTVQVNRSIKTRLIWHEYTRIDTFWYWMGGSSVASTLTAAIDNGVSLANYRGYIGMENFDLSHIDQLTNGFMMPFVVTITCGSGGFLTSGSTFMEKFVDVGQANEPKGAVACVGTATSYTATVYNNTVDYGIFAGLLDEGITQTGNALNRGKLELYNAYQVHEPGEVTDYSKWNCLAGDPGLDVFTGPIRYMSCDIPSTVTWGENALSLTVNEAGIGPLEEAVVCFYKEGDIHEVGLTDANGQVTLPLTTSTAGNVKVTITKHNFYPIVDSLDVVQASVAVGYYGHSIDDDNAGTSSGDGDGTINPGETVEIPLVFKNYGSSTVATGISVTASESDNYATLDDNYETFPNLAPGATGSSIDDLDLTIAENCPHGHIVHLDLVTTSAQGAWEGMLDLEVVSYAINIRSAYAAGSDTVLSPGETANFILEVRNEGGKAAASLTATVVALDPYVTVNDNTASFGNVSAGFVSSCSGDPFNLTAAEDTPPGHFADLEVTFTSSTGASQTDTITIALGFKSQADPQGPDEYGYYCFDNTDLNYDQAPTYAWIEVDPSYSGPGTQLPIWDNSEDDDMSINIRLPFTFRYYGEDVDEITVCSNGWISTWANASYNNFTNYPIPSSTGPNGLIAPFLDDLITSSGHICSYHDSLNHRFIIEWSRVKNRASGQPIETFEIVLYDPVHYPTVTGDGEILFQYQTIVEMSGYYYDNPYSTVGIERPDKQDGIQIVYWNTYDDPAAAHLQAGRAYFFTTNFDYSLPGPDLYVTLTPYGAPIVIPPSGGSFSFNIEVGNEGTVSASADVWCNVTLPSGSVVGPLIGPVTGFSFPAGWSTNRDRTQSVPAGAPAGTYSYNGYIGIYPNIIYDQNSFTFSKSGDDGSGNWKDGWENTGEPFLDPLEAYDETSIPETFSLGQNYPNPFNPLTTIRYELPDASVVNLSIYDISGRRVQSLVNGWRDAGYHEATWDASNFASGLYFYRIQAGDFKTVKKMVLMK